MPTTPHVVEVMALDVRSGIWCDRCALPSVVEVDWVLVDPSTLKVAGRPRRPLRHCDGPECIALPGEPPEAA